LAVKTPPPLGEISYLVLKTDDFSPPPLGFLITHFENSSIPNAVTLLFFGSTVLGTSSQLLPNML